MIRLFLALLLIAAPAFALDPERREVTTISGRLWDGYQYTEMFLPSNAPTLTVIATRDSAIAFVRTQEYYWPLSRQVYVDFEGQRDPVPGVLKIERAGETIAEVSEELYAIVYPDGVVNGNGSLLWGDAAAEGFAAYQKGESDFNRRLVEAQRAQTAYEQALLDAARSGSKELIPPPLALPASSLRLVTRPVSGFRLALEPGSYRMVLIADGSEVLGTGRELRVIEAQGQNELVADILPEERWTRPLPVNSEATRIYARAGSKFYLTLAEATRFIEADYLSIVSPQNAASPYRELWVRRKPATASEMEASTGSGTERISKAEFKVEQTSASGFGYIVRPKVDGETADIEAFEVTVPSSGFSRIALDLASSGFMREVVPVGARNSLMALLLALLPIAAFGVGQLTRSRSQSFH
jgi:hypothetical protein